MESRQDRAQPFRVNSVSMIVAGSKRRSSTSTARR